MSQSGTAMSQPPRIVLWVLTWATLWMLLFWQDLLSAFEVWLGSNTYTHCLFILPLAAFMAWRGRFRLLDRQPRAIPWLAPAILGWLLVWGVGYAADLQFLSHLAMLSIVPMTVLVAMGFNVFHALWFPLTLMMFALPFGEEFVPYLQVMTADNAVWLLQAAGVPVYRDGLYLTIPAGQFVVAEACSGVRFLVASVCFGYFYAFITYIDLWRRALFFAVAIALPLAANSLRVFMIIIIAHKTNMEYAVGADHLVYGWLFFAFVLVCLILVGSLWRQPWQEEQPEHTTGPWMRWPVNGRKTVAVLAFAPLILALGWKLAIQASPQPASQARQAQTLSLTGLPLKPIEPGQWQPQLAGSDASAMFQLGSRAQVMLARFDGGEAGGELVSSQHRFYREESWSRLAAGKAYAEQPEYGQMTLAGHRGNRLHLLYWYQLHNYVDFKPVNVKLMQAFNRLTLEPARPAYLVAIAFESAPESSPQWQHYVRVAEQISQELNSNAR